jgi:hypothetical protein
MATRRTALCEPSLVTTVAAKPITPRAPMRAPERAALARRLRDAALEWVSRHGRLTECAGAEGPVTEAARGSLSLLFTSPSTLARGMPRPYGIDIWDERGKVFSVWWDPFEVVRMDRGPWMRELLDDA